MKTDGWYLFVSFENFNVSLRQAVSQNVGEPEDLQEVKASAMVVAIMMAASKNLILVFLSWAKIDKKEQGSRDKVQGNRQWATGNGLPIAIGKAMVLDAS